MDLREEPQDGRLTPEETILIQEGFQVTVSDPDGDIIGVVPGPMSGGDLLEWLSMILDEDSEE